MNNYLQITSGRGPEECCWVVARLVDVLTREATEAGIKVRFSVGDAARSLLAIPSEMPETMKSALLALEGEKSELEAFVAGWTGTIQWIGRSPFRPHHQRKNWFVGVECLAAPEQIERIERTQKDLEWQTVRGSGPGGQHRNKTETAVRVVHRPTGLSAIAQEERSQALNRKLALARLAQRLQQRQTEIENANRQQQWDLHNNLERGNPKRIYIGQKFDLKDK